MQSDEEVARAVVERRFYGHGEDSQCQRDPLDRTRSRTIKDSRFRRFTPKAGMGWEVEFGGLQVKLLQCYTGKCSIARFRQRSSQRLLTF